MQFLRAYFLNAASAIEVSHRNYQLLPATRSGSMAEASFDQNEFVFRFSYFTFVNEKGIRFSFANLKMNKNSIFVRKFENKKGICFRSQI